MNCHKCSTPLPAGAKFCTNCGASVPSSVITSAQILDFSQYVDERTRHFKGREWVLKVIDDWIAKPNTSRYFLLTGEPGCGKTSIAAQIFQISLGKTPCLPGIARIFPNFISAAHFCSARESTWIDPRIFARSISLQLARNFQEFSQALIDIGEKTTILQAQMTAGEVKDSALVAGFIINNLILSGGNSQEAFNRTVVEPLQTIFSRGFNKPVVIIVDGLDESLKHRGDVTIPMLLSGLNNLPSLVKFILTCRSEPKVENEFPDSDTLFLSSAKFDEYNLKDIKTYVEWRFREDTELKKVLEQFNQTKVSDPVVTIMKKSEGNFRYVTFLLDAIAKRQRAIDDLEGIPEGLDGLYYDSLKRVIDLGRKDWDASYAPFLGILSVAQTSLTKSQIMDFSGLSAGTVWGCIGDLQQFIEVLEPDDGNGEDQYHFYHQSVTDFLQNQQLKLENKKLHNTYYLSSGEWHRQMGKFYLKKGSASWADWDDYGLRFIATHMVKAVQESSLIEKMEITGQLVKIVFAKGFQEIHQRRLKNLISLQRDLKQALNAATEIQSPLSLPMLVESALGLVAFREVQLRPEPLFELASKGNIEEAEKRLSLFLSEREWEQAALLTIAWLSSNTNPGGACKLRDRLIGTLPNFGPLLLLSDRVDAVINGTPLPQLMLINVPSREEVLDIVGRLGGLGEAAFETETEAREGAMAEEPQRGGSTYEESLRMTGQEEGPKLVAYASENPLEGTELLQQYQGILASNGYVYYRNRYLWALLQAILQHPDQQWVLERLVELEVAALKGSKLEFQEGLPHTLLALRARFGTPMDIKNFEDKLNQVRDVAAELIKKHEQVDSWASHKRQLIALAEACNFFPDGNNRAINVLYQAFGLPYGFAGFHAPACLTLAEAARICKAGDPIIKEALMGAQRSAHNIQEPTFCAQTTARVNAMAERWWGQTLLDVKEITSHFVQNTSLPDYTALHLIGESYLQRSPGNRSLPHWVKDANSLLQLSLIYRRRLEDFQRVNPELEPNTPLQMGTRVNVPDPEFAPLLAARFAAEAVASTSISDKERVAVIHSLVPIATSNPTALDTVLSRLLIAACPQNKKILELIEEKISSIPSSQILVTQKVGTIIGGKNTGVRLSEL